jgi:mRNA-degrading endonuclease toxin of MazEF toxin-antitoxin module
LRFYGEEQHLPGSRVECRSRRSVPGVPAGRRNGVDLDSKAQAEQVRSIDVRRLGERLGVVPDPIMAALD